MTLISMGTSLGVEKRDWAKTKRLSYLLLVMVYSAPPKTSRPKKIIVNYQKWESMPIRDFTQTSIMRIPIMNPNRVPP